MALQDQLRALADDVDRAPEVDTAGLARGRAIRHRRRRRVATAATVGAVVAVTGSVIGFADLRAGDELDPATTGERTAALPDALFDPSPWLEGTDDAGPLGPLAFAVTAERGTWTGTTTAVAGVSALTGEYRFLDLPDLAGPGVGNETALSPDGRRVAYWATGPTRETPNTSGGQAEPVGALAVHDATSGETARIEIPSDHGVQPSSLVWSDDETLLASYGYDLAGDDGPEMEQGSSVDYALHVWRPGDTGLTRLREDPYDVVSAGGGLAVVGSRLLAVPCGGCPAPDRIPRAVPGSAPTGFLMNGPVVDPSTRVAAALTGNRSPTRVTLFTESGRREVPGSHRTFDILTFLSPGRLLVRQGRNQDGPIETDLRVLDLEGGGSTRLVDLDEDADGGVMTGTVATGLADRPTFDAVEPPDPLDPRIIAGGVALTVIAGIGYLVSWTRRVRI